MANIFSLFGQIFIDNEKANNSIKETTNAAENSSKKMNVSFSSIVSGAAKVGTAVVGAATTIGTAVYSLATNVADTAGDIDDAAKRVGMSAEEYQKWTYAAKLSGIESSKLESLMTKQQKSFADAKEGSASLSEAYARLGIDMSACEDSSKAFNMVIAALADMEDETTRNAIANDIFGKSYADLAPLLEEGAEGVEALKNEAEELGGVISNETVEAGAELGDTIDKLKTAASGIVAKLGASVIPIINKLLNAVIERLPTITDIIDELLPVISDLAEEVLPPMFELVETLLPPLIEFISELIPVAQTIIESILPVIIELLGEVLPIIVQIVQQVLPVLIALINTLTPLFNLLTPILSLILSLVSSLLTPLLSLITGILTPLISLLTPIINLLNAILTPIITLLNSILTPLLDILNPIVEIINMLLEPLFELDNTLLSGLTDGMFGALSPLKLFQPIIEALSNNISSVLSPVLEHISIAFDTFKTVLSNVISFIKNVFTGNWSGAWENIKNIFSSLWEGIKKVAKNVLNGIIGMFESALNGIISFINTITSGLSNVWTWTGLPAIPQIPKVSWTRLKIGMDYVPYDDYPALLHKGERVLRAYENEEYTAEQKKKKNPGPSDDEDGGEKINVTVNIENLNGADKATADEVADSLGDKLLEIIQELLDRRDKAF